MPSDTPHPYVKSQLLNDRELSHKRPLLSPKYSFTRFRADNAKGNDIPSCADPGLEVLITAYSVPSFMRPLICRCTVASSFYRHFFRKPVYCPLLICQSNTLLAINLLFVGSTILFTMPMPLFLRALVNIITRLIIMRKSAYWNKLKKLKTLLQRVFFINL